MDFVSHILIGRAFASSPKNSRKDIATITLFAFLPDLPSVFLYLYLGLLNSRPLLIPAHSDWNGFRVPNPAWSALWEIPHSVFLPF